MATGRWILGLLLAGGVFAAGAAPGLRPVTAEQLTQVVRTADAPVVLVNIWATWCLPCREEFPALLRLRREYEKRGLRLVLVSWDVDADVARAFLKKQGVAFETYLRAGDQGDPQFIDAFEPQWSGAFPATFVYDRAGQLIKMWEGKRTYEEFEKAMKKIFGREEGRGSVTADYADDAD